MSNRDPRLERVGVSGYNKPKRTPSHPTKSHVVVAKQGDKIKTIRFGQQGVKGAGKNPKTAKDKARKKSYYARHNAQDANPSKLSARYWSHKVKWQIKKLGGFMWGFTLLDKEGNKVIQTSPLYEAERYAFIDGYESCADYPEAYSFYTWEGSDES